mmetsp:Transcript_39802/g.102517  ORF Transcript_39802/g.102517 Transcript_39802/m.102517 type:complete len:253 (+) Transcript_39802:498-1256(+)
MESQLKQLRRRGLFHAITPKRVCLVKPVQVPLVRKQERVVLGNMLLLSIQHVSKVTIQKPTLFHQQNEGKFETRRARGLHFRARKNSRITPSERSGKLTTGAMMPLQNIVVMHPELLLLKSRESGRVIGNVADMEMQPRTDKIIGTQQEIQDAQKKRAVLKLQDVIARAGMVQPRNALHHFHYTVNITVMLGNGGRDRKVAYNRRNAIIIPTKQRFGKMAEVRQDFPLGIRMHRRTQKARRKSTTQHWMGSL